MQKKTALLTEGNKMEKDQSYLHAGPLQSLD